MTSVFGSHWMAVALLALGSLPANAGNKGYHCFGTEPFYDVRISGNTLTFELVGEDKETFLVEGPLSVMGVSERPVAVYKSKEKDAVISIIGGKCSDGMSEREYDLSMIFVKGQTVFAGCCERSKQN